MFKRRRETDTKPVLSDAFVAFVAHLSEQERVEATAKRAESVQEFFRNRSSK
jgi:hypothetical protein